MKVKTRIGTWCAVILSLAVLTACGSTSDSGSGPTGTTSKAELDAAKKFVAEKSAPPTDLGISTPVSKPVPAGKRIAILNCGSPACGEQVKAFKAAAEVLDWSVTEINQGQTADTVHNAWQQILRNVPDGVVSMIQPVSAFKSALETLSERGVPIVDCCSLNDPQGALKYSAGGLEDAAGVGEMMAAKMMVDSDGTGMSVFLSTPAFPVLAETERAYLAYVKEHCKGCGTDTLELAATDIAEGSIATKVVSYLRTHQDVKYVIGGFDDEFLGMPAALRQANLKGVKLIGQNPTATTIPYIKDGTELASISYPSAEYQWLLADVLARLFVGDDIGVDKILLPRRIIDATAVEDVDEAPQIPDYEEKFAALWGKSS